MSARSESEAEVTLGRTGDWESVRLIGPGSSLEATFLPRLGMVGSSLRHAGEELLGQRNGPEGYAERKSTFGIPLLAPWANRLSGWDYEVEGRTVRLDPESPILKADPDTGLPIHGALSASPFWEVTETGSDRDRAWFAAGLDYSIHAELMAVFPFAHRLEFRAEVDREKLSVCVTLIPSGGEAVPVAFGFHPYLALPGSNRADWQLELPVRRRAILDERQIPTGQDEELVPGQLSGMLGDRTFDDSFEELDGTPPVFSVADARRRVEVRYAEGYPVAQMYAPSQSSFIAIEPMTAPVDSLRSGRGLRLVSPGDRFSARFSIGAHGLREHGAVSGAG